MTDFDRVHSAIQAGHRFVLTAGRPHPVHCRHGSSTAVASHVADFHGNCKMFACRKLCELSVKGQGETVPDDPLGESKGQECVPSPLCEPHSL